MRLGTACSSRTFRISISGWTLFPKSGHRRKLSNPISGRRAAHGEGPAAQRALAEKDQPIAWFVSVHNRSWVWRGSELESPRHPDAGIFARVKATPMRHQCDIKATPMRVASQAVATPKPPSCDLKATLKPPSCVPHASLMRPSCDLHAPPPETIAPVPLPG